MAGSIILSPSEKILMSGSARIEQPLEGKGEAYLTDKRLIVIHKSGLIRKKETPLLDIRINQISYVKVEGLLSKVLVLGVTQGGKIITYKLKVPNPESWMSTIYNLLSSEDL